MSLLVFEPNVGGHRGLYLDALLHYRADERIAVPLDLVLARSFEARHPDTWAHAQRAEGVTVHTVGDAPPALSLAALDRRGGDLLGEAIARLRPRHTLAMYFDHLQLSLGSRLRFGFPTRISGVYFRPSFHYGSLGGPAPTLRERATALRKRLVLRWARRNPHLDTIFCLDPFAVPHIARMAGSGRGVFLPDPVPVARAAHAPSPLDDAPADRRTLLLFGVLDERKGVTQVCEALRLLPAADQQRLTLALTGPLDDSLRPTVDRLQSETSVHVLVDDRFVPDAEIQQMIERSDLVLLTYQGHIGSSNVLVRAAAAGVPVLSTDYGLVGAQVRRRSLGASIDAGSPAAIAKALERWLARPDSIPFDADSARTFHAENTARAYADTILSHLLSSR
jgi:glycosyltransferase involved in cell wall biosynthesis